MAVERRVKRHIMLVLVSRKEVEFGLIRSLSSVTFLNEGVLVDIEVDTLAIRRLQY